jgi:carbonic anhydrase
MSRGRLPITCRQAFARGYMRAQLTAKILVLALAAIAAAPASGSGTAAAALARLKAGNQRFQANPSEALPIDGARRTATAAGQSPFAIVFSCADSRVPPEVVFNTGLGDLFVVRAAGQVPDRAVLASLEYGAEHLHVPLLVVMGHESCGAVKAAMESKSGSSLGANLDYLIKAIRPAVMASPNVKAAVLANVEENINDLLEQSPILRELAASGTLTMVGAYYELASGRAHFSEPVAPPALVHTTARLRH